MEALQEASQEGDEDPDVLHNNPQGSVHEAEQEAGQKSAPRPAPLDVSSMQERGPQQSHTGKPESPVWSPKRASLHMLVQSTRPTSGHASVPNSPSRGKAFITVERSCNVVGLLSVGTQHTVYGESTVAVCQQTLQPPDGPATTVAQHSHAGRSTNHSIPRSRLQLPAAAPAAAAQQCNASTLLPLCSCPSFVFESIPSSPNAAAHDLMVIGAASPRTQPVQQSLVLSVAPEESSSRGLAGPQVASEAELQPLVSLAAAAGDNASDDAGNQQDMQTCTSGQEENPEVLTAGDRTVPGNEQVSGQAEGLKAMQMNLDDPTPLWPRGHTKRHDDVMQPQLGYSRLGTVQRETLIQAGQRRRCISASSTGRSSQHWSRWAPPTERVLSRLAVQEAGRVCIHGCQQAQLHLSMNPSSSCQAGRPSTAPARRGSTNNDTSHPHGSCREVPLHQQMLTFMSEIPSSTWCQFQPWLTSTTVLTKKQERPGSTELYTTVRPAAEGITGRRPKHKPASARAVVYTGRGMHKECVSMQIQQSHAIPICAVEAPPHIERPAMYDQVLLHSYKKPQLRPQTAPVQLKAHADPARIVSPLAWGNQPASAVKDQLQGPPTVPQLFSCNPFNTGMYPTFRGLPCELYLVDKEQVLPERPWSGPSQHYKPPDKLKKFVVTGPGALVEAVQ